MRRVFNMNDLDKFRQFLWQINEMPASAIIMTNGCFDLLHVGHVYGLDNGVRIADAKLGGLRDVSLIVAINSDRSVRELKGDKRPFFPAEDRAYLLSRLRSVKGVIIFDTEEQLEQLHTIISPVFYFKGDDYRNHPCITSRPHAFVVPRTANASSSELVRKL